MVLRILLIISVFLQLFAAGAAIGLTRFTKLNLTWILFTIALTLMAMVRLGEYLIVSGVRELHLPPDFFIWLGVCTSLSFAVGVLLVRRLIKQIQNLNRQSRLTEKRILNTVIYTQERERSRFSKDMHDGLGPLLSSIKMSLSALQRNKNKNQTQQIIDNSQLLIEEAISSLREISNNLSPRVLNDFGLDKAISAFIDKSTLKQGFQIDFTSTIPEAGYGNPLDVIIYRIVCELFNNSFKHSAGDKIILDIDYSDNIIRILYRDNGCGFDTSEQDTSGMGLSNIYSRINSIKGEVEIISKQGEGMQANIEIDLNKQDEWKKVSKLL